ncbi:unnamed protein product [Amoebophrya sp. A120]|nr:unnamed protein product [Amoebophrya sp. A120]|eukprot:GSA120T00008840001.1
MGGQEQQIGGVGGPCRGEDYNLHPEDSVNVLLQLDHDLARAAEHKDHVVKTRKILATTSTEVHHQEAVRPEDYRDSDDEFTSTFPAQNRVQEDHSLTRELGNGNWNCVAEPKTPGTVSPLLLTTTQATTCTSSSPSRHQATSGDEQKSHDHDSAASDGVHPGGVMMSSIKSAAAKLQVDGTTSRKKSKKSLIWFPEQDAHDLARQARDTTHITQPASGRLPLRSPKTHPSTFCARVLEKRGIFLDEKEHEGKLREIAEFFDQRVAKSFLKRHRVVATSTTSTGQIDLDHEQSAPPSEDLIDDFYFTVEGDWLTTDEGDGFVRFHLREGEEEDYAAPAVCHAEHKDSDTRVLYRHLAYLEKINIPMVLLAKQPEKYPLFLDVDIWAAAVADETERTATERPSNSSAPPACTTGQKDLPAVPSSRTTPPPTSHSVYEATLWTEEKEKQFFHLLAQAVATLCPGSRVDDHSWEVECFCFQSHGRTKCFEEGEKDFDFHAAAQQDQDQDFHKNSYKKKLKKLDFYKISYHLVFPQILVDRPTNCLLDDDEDETTTGGADHQRRGRYQPRKKNTLSLHEAAHHRIKDFFFEQEDRGNKDLLWFRDFLTKHLTHGTIAEKNEAIQLLQKKNQDGDNYLHEQDGGRPHDEHQDEDEDEEPSCVNDWTEIFDDNPLWHEKFPSATGMRLLNTAKRPDESTSRGDDEVDAAEEDDDEPRQPETSSTSSFAGPCSSSQEDEWRQNDFRAAATNKFSDLRRVKKPGFRFSVNGCGDLVVLRTSKSCTWKRAFDPSCADDMHCKSIVLV